LTFDEYVKLKNLNKQLIISPPMKNPPVITPSNASKYINIKIKDTLQPNTPTVLILEKALQTITKETLIINLNIFFRQVPILIHLP
jgi:hypothetical protein